jgi:flagellar motor switch protein FliM
MPYSMVEPIRDLLDAGVQSDRGDKDERWERSLRICIQDADLELNSTLAETKISVKEMAELKKGDIIPVDIPEMVELSTSNIPLFRGQVGISGGNYAIKIREKIHAPTKEDIQELYD